VSLFGALADRVRDGLRRTRQLMDNGLDAVLAVGRPVDDALLDELEETLIAADLGTAAAGLFVARVRAEAKRGRAVSSQDVRYLELHGAQHAFEVFPSIRCNAAIAAVDRFLTNVYERHQAEIGQPEALNFPGSEPVTVS